MSVPCKVATLVCRLVPNTCDISLPGIGAPSTQQVLLLRRKWRVPDQAPDGTSAISPAYRSVWSLPGGPVSRGEAPIDAARRWVKETAGLDIEPTTFYLVPFSHSFHRDEAWVSLYFMAWVEAEARPQKGEPGTCLELRFCPWDGFPKPLSISLCNLLEEIRRT